MKRSFRDKWSAALRSGNYPQGRGYLCKNGRSCCLGVALFVEGVEHPEVRIGGITHFGVTREELQPSGDSINRIGLDAYVVHRLIAMNDRELQSFSEIADYLDTLPVEEDTAP